MNNELWKLTIDYSLTTVLRSVSRRVSEAVHKMSQKRTIPWLTLANYG